MFLSWRDFIIITTACMHSAVTGNGSFSTSYSTHTEDLIFLVDVVLKTKVYYYLPKIYFR